MPIYESSNKIDIEFATVKAKNDFKKLTGTNVRKNDFLDITKIFSLDLIPEENRQFYCDELLSCHQEPQRDDNIYTSGMWENGLTLSYRFYTTTPPFTLIRKLYIYFHIKRITLHYRDMNDMVFINEKQKIICMDSRYKCKKSHKNCVLHHPTMKLDLDWSGLSHPIFEPKKTIDEIKRRVENTDEKSIAFFYKLLISELTLFNRISFGAIRDARNEFDMRVEKTNNVLLKLMATVGDYSFPKDMTPPRNLLPDFMATIMLCWEYQKMGISSEPNDPVLDKLKKPKKKK